MDVKTLHSAIRQCEADCEHIERLLVTLLAQPKPHAAARARGALADQSLRRLLSSLDGHAFDVWSAPRPQDRNKVTVELPVQTARRS